MTSPGPNDSRTRYPSSAPLGGSHAGPSHNFHLFTIEELLTLPPASWLIRDVIHAGSFTVLYGAPGSGKSFVAQDMALHVAAGQSWCGRQIKAGPVVYSMAEGLGSLRARIVAAIQGRPLLRTEGSRFVLEAVCLLDLNAVSTLLHKFNAYNLKPSLIVIDTLARCFVGGDENSAQVMGKLVQAIGYLQRETDAAVLLLHHCGKPGDAYSRKPSERGSSALRGAAESMIRLEQGKTEHQIVLVNDKQRDAAEFSPITLWLTPVVVVGMEDPTGEPVTSCVVSEVSQHDDVSPQATLGVHLRTALAVLVDFPGSVASSTDWQAAIEQRLGKPVPARTFQNWRRNLLTAGLIHRVLVSRPSGS